MPQCRPSRKDRLVIAFIVCLGVAGAEQEAHAVAELTSWRSRYPALAARPVQRWTSRTGLVRCFWVAHGPEDIGGVTYTTADADRFALFAGRPIRWHGDTAEGRKSLDPATYLADPGAWAADLDGRYAVVRVVDERFQLLTDPVGLQPVYEATRAGITWISNVAPLLEHPEDPPNDRSLVAFLATGEGPTGEPLNAALRRVTPGTLVTVAPDGERAETPNNRITPDSFAGPPDYDEAADILVSVCAAMADWPRRPRLLAMTGGYDSRLLGSAARKAGIETGALTLAIEGAPGFPETEDVELGRLISGDLGLAHHLVRIDRDIPLYRDPAAVATDLRRTSPGTVAMNDVLDFGVGLPGGGVPLVFEGTGGELARSALDTRLGRAGNLDGYRDSDRVEDMAEGILRRMVPPATPTLVGAAGLDVVRSWLRATSTELRGAGYRMRDIPEVCFLQSQGTWHGSKTTSFDHRQEPLSPLLSRRLWPHMLGASLERRRRGEFHQELTRRLGPDVVDKPYCSLSQYGGREQRLRTRDWVEHRRQVEQDAAAARGDAPWVSPLARVHAGVRAAVSVRRDHAAWPVLDEERVATLAATDPATLDRMGSNQIWRLATLLLPASSAG
jgi:hypothetical protein